MTWISIVFILMWLPIRYVTQPAKPEPSTTFYKPATIFS